MLKRPLPNLALSSAISAHLIAEVLRRFLGWSDLAYGLADMFVLTAALVVIVGYGIRLDKRIIIAFGIYVFFGVASHLGSGHPIILVAVGLRPLVLGIAVYAIAEVAFSRVPDTSRRLRAVLSVWLVIITVVAVYQIEAGVSAPINQIEGLPRGGRGDPYGGLDWLFRPTSIFMHTGRFGQFTFFLALIFVLPILSRRRHNLGVLLLAGCALFAVLLSGQRAAFVLLILAVLGIVLLQKRGRLALRLGTLLTAIFGVVAAANARVLEAVVDRVVSGFLGGFERVAEQGAGWSTGFMTYPLLGEGLGFFSLGAEPFGGEIYYSYMGRFGGGGENSWLSIQGEVGILGVAAFAVGLLLIVSRALRAYIRSGGPNGRNWEWHIAAAVFPLALSLWALTHHVFSNYLHMIALFTLFGASAGLERRRLLSQANADGRG
ncbi:hypothetical protein GH984_07310 [Spiribacter sp. C176]|uniref:O-antigen ligase domain-containing protein n=1 Tax=Spiribacter salilacus TaxID=2664894 RepID=A0A6N7QR89_9GAMM|nr:hypothetical protein [Spiribacter salilacus]